MPNFLPEYFAADKRIGLYAGACVRDLADFDFPAAEAVSKEHIEFGFERPVILCACAVSDAPPKLLAMAFR